jgi:hypothetical protein
MRAPGFMIRRLPAPVLVLPGVNDAIRPGANPDGR